MNKTKTRTKKSKRSAAEIKQLQAIVSDIANREMIEVEKTVVEDLASCVLWALKFLKSPSGGLWTDLKAKPMIMKPWQEKFMEALDGVGYHIDRKDFWNKQDEKASKKRKRQ